MKPRVGICSILLTSVNALAYGSHLAFVSRLREENPEFDFFFFGPHRVPIDEGRNACVRYSLANNFDYIMFYDDDTEIDAHIFKKLISREKDAIGAAYFVRGYPFNLMAFIEVPNSKDMKAIEGEGKMWDLLYDFEDRVGPDGLLGPLKAIGNGCSLIKTEVFRMIPDPWFLTQRTPLINCTEDVYFYSKAQQHISNFEVWMDMTCNCGHYMDPIAVDLTNYKVLREMSEKLGRHRGEGKKVWLK